ncbi:hypothetical protein BU23DRAFT_129236 [Bimuria novae-zelandiae CBS 107.79]|uniref:Uncharacterized protein n=1 Tax=Bimuria novae-zelandiae CBS 107.79 TaxID=1447943 RepID=A0A6A5VBJ5_9PLEO|nr:hypothetical protein BU23DRAFT_129236 [Bimuria novae-zelandiae CBS 107.79]
MASRTRICLLQVTRIKFSSLIRLILTHISAFKSLVSCVDAGSKNNTEKSLICSLGALLGVRFYTYIPALTRTLNQSSTFTTTTKRCLQLLSLRQNLVKECISPLSSTKSAYKNRRLISLLKLT